ncbi:MAG TPA: hypothetical protein VJ793_17295 [Anaerolineae bacterium]|nr:hypothetical protein [Anaerolineae bacterium]
MLDQISGYIAEHKGVPVLAGVLLVILNFAVVLLSRGTWLADTNLLLHLGVVVGLMGILLGDALGR